MEVFLQTLVAGLFKGGLYALIGIGMTMIMGVICMGIINLAHGQMMIFAMYLTFVCLHYMGINSYVALLISMPALFRVGVGVQKFLLNSLLKVQSLLPENQVFMTVGIVMVMTEILPSSSPLTTSRSKPATPATPSSSAASPSLWPASSRP